MIVLVDTPVWSLALRRRPSDLNQKEDELKLALSELIREGRAQMIGPIRQEILSGLREEAQFQRLAQYLRGFEDAKLATEDYEQAAQICNRCRSRGIAGSAIDFLICAVVHRRGWQIFTTDRDFAHYGKVLPIQLYARL